MSQVYITLPLLVLVWFRFVYGFPDNTIMLLPPFEGRTSDSYPSYPYSSQFQAHRHTPRQVLHTNMIQKNPPQAPFMEKQNNQNITFSEFLESLNEAAHYKEQELQRPRITGSASRDDNPAYSSLPQPTGYSRPNYAPPSTYHASTYHENPSVLSPLTPPPSMQPKVPLLKPDFSSLLTPVTTKFSSKISGLLGLVLSLLTGSAGGLEATGFKDVLINGIIKPLLIAKGGIKALISKLVVPVIALLLINVEVLIIVWWLWEECPAKLEPTPSYSKPAYNYNSYR